MHRVALGDVVFALLPKILPGLLKQLKLFGFKRPDDVETRLVLVFVKAHLLAPSGRRISFSGPIRAAFSLFPPVYSFLLRFRADSCLEKMQNLSPPVERPAGWR